MVVYARRTDVGVAEPFLNLRNVGTLIQRICRRSCAGGVGAEALHRDSDLFAVAFDHPVDAGGLQGGFQAGAGGVGSHGFEEQGVAVGAMAGGVQVFGDGAQGASVDRDVAQFLALAVDAEMLHAATADRCGSFAGVGCALS